ncbi:nucleotidyltransferase domain-containing protein [Atrimonas thermophila]|uniref:nucleotidyltransferase domain-containing protein n=1 Tax=Atrimonas thermophila TaxID=3064161 RepID=UPI00399CA771
MKNGDNMLEATLEKLRTFSPSHKQYIKEVLTSIIEHYGNLLCVLAIFGSYARGENRKNSDLDLLVILERSQSLRKRLEEFEEAIKRTEPLAQELYEKEGIYCEPSPYILSRDEAFTFQPIYFDLYEHHILVFDPQNMFPRLIASIGKVLREYRAQKFSWGNFWGWKAEKFLGGIKL